MLTLTMKIEEIPPDHTGTHPLAHDTLETSAETYEEALDQVERQMPENWRAVAIAVDRS